MESPKLRKASLLELMEKHTFTQAVYYAWTGKLPSADVLILLNACLVAIIDHGPETLSAKASRVVSSGGAEMNAAVAAGLLAAGKHHGAIALRDATVLLREAVAKKRTAKQVVAAAMKEKRRLPGFGHRVYTTDPRAQALIAMAKELKLADKHLTLALAIEKELEARKGKKLCLNVDGAIAALLPAMGIPADVAPGVFLLARSAGLVMQVAEEQQEKPASQRKA